MPVIREFEVSDAAQVEQLFDDFQDYLVPLDRHKRLRREQGYGLAYLVKTLGETRLGGGALFVAENDGTLVGLVAGYIEPNEPINEYDHVPSQVGRITEVYVTEPLRGSGLAQALMERIEVYLRKKGCDSCRLAVFAPNKRARRFYEKLGYEERDIELFKLI